MSIQMTIDTAGHIEATIGRIGTRWYRDESKTGVAIARVPDSPRPGTATYVTLGASERVVRTDGDRELRQEFLTVAQDRFKDEYVASFLVSFAELMLPQPRALHQGDVVGPSESVLASTRFSAVYAREPVLHDPRAQTFDGMDPPVSFVWVVPIHAGEAEFVRTEGWREFEALLEGTAHQLGDLNRGPLV